MGRFDINFGPTVMPLEPDQKCPTRLATLLPQSEYSGIPVRYGLQQKKAYILVRSSTQK